MHFVKGWRKMISGIGNGFLERKEEGINFNQKGLKWYERKNLFFKF